MENRALITSCSDKFFPSVINLIGSVKRNYPGHPPIFVYNLGLLPTFKKELQMIEGVTVIDMPEFCQFWRSCYTWKTYILAHPLAELNFYLDAGCQVLRPLDQIFETIKERGAYLINQTASFESIVPADYKSIFDIGNSFDKEQVIHAGIIGFKNNEEINNILNKVYNAALAGLALGFSQKDAWRNKGKNKTIFVRDCQIFRHDLTLLNIFFRKYYNEKIVIEPIELFYGENLNDGKQFVWQLRLNYSKLQYSSIKSLHSANNLTISFNHIIIWSMLLFKISNLRIKRLLGIIKK